jgi:hypothetical protein
MISEAFVLDAGQSYQFSVFDSVEPKFDEVLIEKNIRAGKYESFRCMRARICQDWECGIKADF